MARNCFVSLFFIGVVFFSDRCRAQIQSNADEAFRISSEANKPVLLVFAGSDWCANCIRFEKRILSSSDFLSFAEKDIVVLKADFPQRTPISAALEQQNASLAEKYNPEGLFPYLLLLSPEKSVLSSLVYRDQTPSEFINEIQTFITK
jgi:thiamine biosynthesis lipoprotein